jgi:hypothetical protein
MHSTNARQLVADVIAKLFANSSDFSETDKHNAKLIAQQMLYDVGTLKAYQLLIDLRNYNIHDCDAFAKLFDRAMTELAWSDIEMAEKLGISVYAVHGYRIGRIYPDINLRKNIISIFMNDLATKP